MKNWENNECVLVGENQLSLVTDLLEHHLLIDASAAHDSDRVGVTTVALLHFQCNVEPEVAQSHFEPIPRRSVIRPQSLTRMPFWFFANRQTAATAVTERDEITPRNEPEIPSTPTLSGGLLCIHGKRLCDGRDGGATAAGQNW